MSINAKESIDPRMPELYSLTRLEAACDTARIEGWEFFPCGDGAETAHVKVVLYKDGERAGEHLEIFNVPGDVSGLADPRGFLYAVIEITAAGADTPEGTVDRLETADVSFKEGLKRMSEGLEERLSEVMDEAFRDEAEDALAELETLAEEEEE